jgi:hypothetical protein
VHEQWRQGQQEQQPSLLEHNTTARIPYWLFNATAASGRPHLSTVYFLISHAALIATPVQRLAFVICGEALAVSMKQAARTDWRGACSGATPDSSTNPDHDPGKTRNSWLQTGLPAEDRRTDDTFKSMQQ